MKITIITGEKNKIPHSNNTEVYFDNKRIIDLNSLEIKIRSGKPVIWKIERKGEITYYWFKKKFMPRFKSCIARIRGVL